MTVVNTPQKKSLSAMFEKSIYSIPLYQRAYAWQENNWKELWSDIKNQILKNDSEHFMGAVVYYPDNKNKAKYNSYQIIDGQQRLTTLTILFRVIYEKIKSTEGDYYNRTADEKYKKYIGSPEDDVLYLSLSKKDRSFFEDYIQKENPNRRSTGKLTSNKNIRKCYEYFVKTIDEEYSKREDTENIAEFCLELLKKIESSTIFIAIDVLNESDAYLIFESINSKRQGLVLSDLLKNYIFSAAHSYQNNKTDSSKLSDMEEKWDYMENALDKIEVNQFVRQFWISKHGDSKGNVFEKELYNTIKKGHTSDKEICDFLVDLVEEVDVYVSIVNSEYIKKKDNDFDYLDQLLTLRNRQFIPLILSAAKAECSSDEIKKLLKCLATLSVRRAIVGKNPNELETFFIKNSPKLRYKKIKISEIVDELYKDYWEDDESVSKTLERDSFEEQEQLAKFILKEYERATVDPIDEKKFNKISLEHVLPRNPANYNDWYKGWSDTDINKEHHSELCWNLGNLALIGNKYNSAMSNNSFKDKKEHLEKSIIFTTKSIASNDSWHEEQIKERNKTLRDFCVLHWSKDEKGN